MSSPYAVHPMEAAFRAWEIERAAHDRKIAELWKSVQGERHDDALDYFRRGFFLGSNYQKDQLVSEASPLGHAAKEAECVAKCLDDAGTPKADGGEELSLWGRVVRYAATLAAAPLLPAGQQDRGGTENLAEALSRALCGCEKASYCKKLTACRIKWTMGEAAKSPGTRVEIFAPATSGEATAAQGAWRSMSSAPTSRPIILRWRTAPWPLRGEWSIDEEFDTRPKGWVSPESGWRNDGDQCIPRNQEDCIGWQDLPAVPGNLEALK